MLDALTIHDSKMEKSQSSNISFPVANEHKPSHPGETGHLGQHTCGHVDRLKFASSTNDYKKIENYEIRTQFGRSPKANDGSYRGN
jgi:hypothetical protein